MSRQSIQLDDELYQYLLDSSLRETPPQQALRQETAHHPMARMQIAPEQGQFMAMLVQLSGARRCLEIGTYTGYSALCIAQALPADGSLLACDISEEWTVIGQPFWQQAGVDDKIQLRIAPALETLDALLADGQVDSFDFAFIDADKPNYPHYYEKCLQLLRKGGLILVDNVLWGGSVVDPQDDSEDTVAIRDFNQQLHQDQRVTHCMLPVADGLSLAIKQ